MNPSILTHEDYAQILSALERLAACDTPAALAQSIVEDAGRMIPSQSCAWVEIHRDSGFSHGAMNVPVDHATVAREMAAVIHDHPIFQEFMRTGDGRARTISELVPRRRFQASPFYSNYLRKYGVEDQLIIAAAYETGRLTVLTLNRSAWGFTEREKAILDALRPTLFQSFWRLRQLAELAIARDGVRLSKHVRPALVAALRKKGLHPREAEVAAILAEGDSNRAIAATLGISEGTVRKHVNRIFLKLGVHNRAAATRAALGVLPRQER